MLKRLAFVFVVFVFIFLVKSTNVSGQTISSDNNCENNLSLLLSVPPSSVSNNQIIIIAYRSKKEKLIKYSYMRLQRIKFILGDKNAIFAIGENSFTKPRIEIYVNGKLDFVFETKDRELLRAGSCGN